MYDPYYENYEKKSTCEVFVDLGKVFDNVDKNKLFVMLRDSKFKYRDRRIIDSICKDQMVAIKID